MKPDLHKASKHLHARIQQRTLQNGELAYKQRLEDGLGPLDMRRRVTDHAAPL